MEDLRYELVTGSDLKLCETIKLEHFKYLSLANVLYIFDTKKKITGGRITFARIKKMNDEMKFLTMDDSGLIYDYVIFIDKNIWYTIEDRDKERIIFHEFCHCIVDTTKKNPFGIQDHEIQGFYDEYSFNIDDEKWSERLSATAESLYDEDNQ